MQNILYEIESFIVISYLPVSLIMKNKTAFLYGDYLKAGGVCALYSYTFGENMIIKVWVVFYTGVVRFWWLLIY